jgi:hypothetical protein
MRTNVTRRTNTTAQARMIQAMAAMLIGVAWLHAGDAEIAAKLGEHGGDQETEEDQ